MWKRLAYLGALALTLPACEARRTADAVAEQPELSSFELARCVNMGSALEAPNEGEWGHTINLAHFARIKEAGFDTVRLPVKWSGHIGEAPDFAIDEAFAARVDEILAAALEADLRVILNVHHFEELMADPAGNMPAFEAIWRQLATRYQDLPARVSFEVLNEPNEAMKGRALTKAQSAALEIIRQSNPSRPVILGGEGWSNIETLGTNLETEDPNVVFTFHYYEPYNFTHQNAPWAGPEGPKDVLNWGTPKEDRQLREDMEIPQRYMEETGRTVFLGEFGAYEAGPMQARLSYSKAVRTEAEAAGIGWCTWSFAVSFPVFDLETDTWVPGFREALGLNLD